MAKSKSKSGGRKKKAVQAKVSLSQLKSAEMEFLKARSAYARKHYPISEACIPFGKIDTLSDYSKPSAEFDLADPMYLENRYNRWCAKIDEMYEECKKLLIWVGSVLSWLWGIQKVHITGKLSLTGYLLK